MKKLILLPVLVVSMVTAGFAQQQQQQQSTTIITEQPPVEPQASPSSPGGFYLGVEYLPTFTSFDVKQIDGGVYKTKFVMGHGFGGILGYNFSDHFALQGEVMYNALSQKYTDEADIERRIDLNYINIPLLAVFNTNSSKAVNLNLAVGPQVGINVGSEVHSGDAPGDGIDTVAAVVAVKAGDLGIAYGAGIDFGLGESVQLGLGYRGVLGIVDISDDNKSTTTNQYYVLDRAHVKTYAAYAALKFRF